MKEGKLIVFAGCEGCGKTTCIHQLKGTLPPELFTFTREPGGTSDAERIRDFFLNIEVTPYEELLAIELARSIHFRQKVLPTLRSGMHVISDRCHETAWAYQVYAKDQEPDLGELYTLLDPRSRLERDVDLWIYFDIDAREALARKMKTAEVNIFDSRPMEFHLKVQDGLQCFFEKHQSRVVSVDATLPIETLAKKVHGIVHAFCLAN